MTPEQQRMAKLEVELMTAMFEGMKDICQKKCIPTDYHDGELSKAEGVCVDRCFAKFSEIEEHVGKKFQEQQQAAQADMQAMQEAQQKAPIQNPK